MVFEQFENGKVNDPRLGLNDIFYFSQPLLDAR